MIVLRKGLWLCVCCLLVVACKTQYKVKEFKRELYSIKKGMPLDSSVTAFYYPYKVRIDSQINVVVGKSAKEITRSKPEGLLNNLVSDALAEMARQDGITFDFLHINYKALRVPLPKGNIKAYSVFEMIPFENYFVTVKLKGDDIYTLFQYMAALGGDPVSGASYRIENGKAIDILINGKTLDRAKTYTVLTNDYFANGGDNASVYLRALERKDYAIKQRDAFFKYLEQQQRAGIVLDPGLDGRVKSDKPLSYE